MFKYSRLIFNGLVFRFLNIGDVIKRVKLEFKYINVVFFVVTLGSLFFSPAIWCFKTPLLKSIS